MKAAKQSAIALLTMVLFQYCAPSVTGLATEGRILKAEQDRVYVLFEDKLGKPGRYTGGWFYFPGLDPIREDEYYVQVNLVRRGTVRTGISQTKNPQ